ncbi:hypothetical protein HLB23_28055 [Nocardia uniformis]|uniref:Uncharacterized protein n=1 Tax=Nocardia uniformis TaxID=53432 RepID=A0A849CBE5_9NOCA|nr:hypothetical protein [Nocardia uniformis]
MWDRPVPHSGARAPMVWLLGAHGGAGVSTLERVLAPAADAQRRWPAVLDGESPFVVIVARETLDGLARAHELLRQHRAGNAGPSHVLGLITCAHQPGRVPLDIRRYRRVIDELVPEGGSWRVGWQPAWPLTQRSDLPVWRPDSPYPSRGSDPLAAARELGHHLLAAVSATATRETTDQLTTGAAA